MKVITFSTQFPSFHLRAGASTYFVDKILLSLIDVGEISIGKALELGRALNLPGFANMNTIRAIPLSPKHHTIRAGNRWKAGDWFSPRIWGNDINPKSGKSGPYQSKQIQFAPDIQIKKVFSFEVKVNIIDGMPYRIYFINGKADHFSLTDVSVNDGLEVIDLMNWFLKPFEGQIICWNENINY